MLCFILYVFYMKQEKKPHRINIAPVYLSMCVCKHAVRSGYNHESKGLKNEQTDLPELQYLFFFSPLFYLFYFVFLFFKKKKKNALVLWTDASKSVFKVAGCSFSCLWSSANILPRQLFPSQKRQFLDLCDDRVAAFFGFLSVCICSACLSVAAGESLFSTWRFWCFHVWLSKMCREEGQVLCSKDFFFFTWFWYHVAWS